MIDKLKTKHPEQMLCSQLNVAVSGYSANCNGKPTSSREQEYLCLIIHLRAAHVRGCGVYGAIKIQSELVALGIQVGVNCIKSLRKLAHIKSIHKRKFRVTTDSKHKLPDAPNLLNRQFTQSAPNKMCVADTTYILTDEGWLYLSAVKDLHICEIVDWYIDERMTKSLMYDALRAAFWRKKPTADLMHHSDYGSQYCAKEYLASQL